MTIFGVLKVVENSKKIGKMLFRVVVAQCFGVSSISLIVIEKIQKKSIFVFYIYVYIYISDLVKTAIFGVLKIVENA